LLTRRHANSLTCQLADSLLFSPFRLIFIFCQEASPKTKVMTVDFTRLPRQNTSRNLAHFDAPFGILNIGGKREKASPRGEAFCFWVITGSRLPATGHQLQATVHCPLTTVTRPEVSQFACLNPKQKSLEEGRRQANHPTTPQGGRRRVVPGRLFSLVPRILRRGPGRSSEPGLFHTPASCSLDVPSTPPAPGCPNQARRWLGRAKTPRAQAGKPGSLTIEIFIQTDAEGEVYPKAAAPGYIGI
jgi:hypothetical protein